MKIYFAGSIAGGRRDLPIYLALIEHLRRHGEVLTEHVGDPNLSETEFENTDPFIHDRDLKWLLSSDIVVAEITTPSLGVGYEIATAVHHHKRVLCLYRRQPGKRISAMIAGCPHLLVREYSRPEEANLIIDSFLEDGLS